MTKKILNMERSIGILRNQNQMLVNAITAAGFEIKHENNLFILKPIKTAEERAKDKKEELRNKRRSKKAKELKEPDIP